VTKERWISPGAARALRIRQAVAANLKREREQAGFTQQELAALCDVPPSTVSRIERTEAEARLSTLTTFASELGVPLECLLQGLLGSVPDDHSP
jgi:transcriptional regulator with XRE-family HTH domain